MIEVESAFEGGAVQAVVVAPGGTSAAETTISFEAPLAGSPAGMWFCFCVRGARGRRLRLVQTNVRQMLGGRHYGAVLPVARDGAAGPWRRLPRGDVAWDGDAGTLTFTALAQDDAWYCAYAHPYVHADLVRLLRELSAAPDVRQEVVGQTQRGRDLPCVLVGPRHGARHLMVCTGRHHSGEAPGSHVLEGVLRAAASGDGPGATWLRRHALLAVFPMVDLDGVVEGRYGKDRPPVDPNRDWAHDPVRPEVRAVRAAIDRLAAETPPSFFCDFHAPAPRDPTYFVPGHPALADRRRWDAMVRFARAMERHASPLASCRVADSGYGYLDWANAHYELISSYSMQLRYGVPTGTLEATYHQDAAGHYVTPDALRDLGRAWVESVADLLRDAPPEAAPPATTPPSSPADGGEAGAIHSGVTRALQERQSLADLPAVGWGTTWRLVNRLRGLRVTWQDDRLHATPDGADPAGSQLRACVHAAFPLAGQRGASLRLPVVLDAPLPATVELALSYLHQRQRYSALDVRSVQVLPGPRTIDVRLRPPEGADALRLTVAARDLPGTLTLGVPEVPA